MPSKKFKFGDNVFHHEKGLGVVVKSGFSAWSQREILTVVFETYDDERTALNQWWAEDFKHAQEVIGNAQ